MVVFSGMLRETASPCTIVGGWLSMVALTASSDHGPVPSSLVALTWNAYSVFMSRPVILTDVDVWSETVVQPEPPS